MGSAAGWGPSSRELLTAASGRFWASLNGQERHPCAHPPQDHSAERELG